MRAVVFYLIVVSLTMSSCKQMRGDKITLASIDRELIVMAKKDQRARKSHNIMEMQSVDKINSIRLKEIIDQYGWPDSRRFSKEASEAAWLILQHASHDLTFQKEGLELMKKTKGGGVDLGHVAYLEDRVSLFENDFQIYGTQGYCVGRKFVLSPINNEENINIMRRNANLPPLEVYIEMASQKVCN